MADHRRERKIPVFSVWKNNAILKNIFLINAPPSIEVPREQEDQDLSENGETHHEYEETLMIGRHPDCDIRLEHPSISRFHLRVHSIPSSSLLSITDLSSVHGTSVSGKRIEPNVRTRLNEGDTLRIGGSSRVYKMHWIPLSQAYDMEHPFVPPLDSPEPHEDEEEEEEKEIIKDENYPGSRNENVQFVNSVSKGLELVVSCQDDELVAEKVVSEAPALQEENTVAVKNEDLELVSHDLEGLESLFGGQDSDVCVQNENCNVCENKDPGSGSLFHDANSDVCVRKEVKMQKENSEELENEDYCLESLFENENSEVLEKEIPAAAPMPNENSEVCVYNSGSESLLHDENSEWCMAKEIQIQNEKSEAFENESCCVESLFEDVNCEVGMLNEIPPAPEMQDHHSEILKNEDRQVEDSALDGLVPLFLGENWEWIGHQNPLSCPAKEYDPIPFMQEEESFINSILNGLDFPFLNKTSKLPAHEYIPSAPPMPEDMTFHLTSNLDNSLHGRTELSARGNEKQSLLHEEDDQNGSWNFWYGSLVERPSPPVKDLLPDTENYNLDKENQYTQHESEPRVLCERTCLERVKVEDTPSAGECKDSKLWTFWSGNMGVESVCSSSSEAEAFSESRLLKNGCQSPNQLSSGKKQFGSPLLTPEHNSACSIWSRRGKQESAPQILTSRTKGKQIKTDQENVKGEPISRALFHGVDDEDDTEIFTPDKENFTPNTHKSMRKLAVLKEAKRSGKLSFLEITGPDFYHEDGLSQASDKEKHSPKVLQEKKTVRRSSVHQVKPLVLKERKGERVPFQTLLAESPQKCTSETCIPDAAVRSRKSVNCAKPRTKTHSQDRCTGEERTRKWNVVVDTTTLLNKESRKALQLLAGLKGTQLIIPRIVITELDCLKRQVSFFRRNSEVLSALEWIQDCMAETQWWIQVQSSMEEGRPVAPTPPASPLSHFSCGTHFSAFESRAELLSPSPEDHVLDYALGFRRTRNDGQLILLSNDITLKIKAMAEGLICEGAEEFRESLVNPFSERFLWADSSPRGQTWSCLDDIVLKEKFYPSCLKMTPKAMENAKGLKLILLHNSQYFERMAAIH